MPDSRFMTRWTLTLGMAVFPWLGCQQGGSAGSPDGDTTGPGWETVGVDWSGTWEWPGAPDGGTPETAAGTFCEEHGEGSFCAGDLRITCTDGQMAGTESCPLGCIATQEGLDQCAVDPGPTPCDEQEDGSHCQGVVLMTCFDGALVDQMPCAHGCAQEDGEAACVSEDPGGDPLCSAQGDGDWCLENKVVHCTGGWVVSTKLCDHGCDPGLAAGGAQCKAGEAMVGGTCPSGDGLYCGEPLGEDPNVLYYCKDGSISPQKTCPNGCEVNPPGSPDSCKGSAAGTVDGKLVLCNPFKPAKSITCGFGCYGGHKGSDYAAAVGTPLYSPITGSVSKADNGVGFQTCDPDFGCYVKIEQGPFDVILAHMSPDLEVSTGQGVSAGDHVGYVSNTGYTMTLKGGEWVCMQGGGYHVHLETRKDGVAFDPIGSSDVVWVEDCGSAVVDPGSGFCVGKMNGLWCQGDLLVTCQDGGETGSQSCVHGCQSNPVGTPDQCKDGPTGDCPFGNGAYCGSTLGLDPNTLYDCVNGQTSVLAPCSAGCEVAPPGQADTCKEEKGSCPSGNGDYCGSSVGLDSNTLYTCSDGNYTAKESCQNGCHVAPPGQADYCEPATPGCPSGNGLYCGETGGLDTKTLYNCQNGSWNFSAYCAAGCNVAPPGQADSCKSGACPSGNGAYCGQTGGLDSGKLYMCSNAKWTVLENCPGSCKIAPPGQPDTCG